MDDQSEVPQGTPSGTAGARAIGPREVRTYEVSVDGFSPMLYCARSPAKARARCFRDYQSYSESVTFHRFLCISRIRRVDNPRGVGDRIMVAGLPATRVLGPHPDSQYVYFMRDEGDMILCSHPADVTTAPTGRGDSDTCSTPRHAAHKG